MLFLDRGHSILNWKGRVLCWVLAKRPRSSNLVAFLGDCVLLPFSFGPGSQLCASLGYKQKATVYITVACGGSWMSTGFLTHSVYAVCSLQVLEEAKVEVPLFPFSIVQFSFEPFSPIFAEELKQSVSRWTLLNYLITTAFFLKFTSTSPDYFNKH